MGLEITKCYCSYSFHPIWVKIYEKYGSHGEYKVMGILAICQKIKNFVSLWNFSIGVHGKPKMLNISETADRRAKRTKSWDSGYYSAHIYGVFYARFLEFILGSFSALCKIFNSTIFETLLLQQFSSNFNRTSYKVSQSAVNIGYYFFGDLCHFEFFLNTGPYGARNFKTLFLSQFSSHVSQTLWRHWATMAENRLLLSWRSSKF